MRATQIHAAELEEGKWECSLRLGFMLTVSGKGTTFLEAYADATKAMEELDTETPVDA